MNAICQCTFALFSLNNCAIRYHINTLDTDKIYRVYIKVNAVAVLNFPLLLDKIVLE